ncbi:MAG: hypothetical protein IJW70_00155 [Clostridia bacterium]|nr:hypothetical protein [Clostridia bacterium]
MNEQDKKVILKKQEIVQQHKKDQLTECLKTVVAEVFFLAFCVLVTYTMISGWYDHIWLYNTVMILISVLLWFIAVLVANTAVRRAIFLLCLNNGKYAIEIDRVKLLELKTEEQHTPSRSGRGSGRTEIVTNQYVHFEKYGKVKANRPLKNGQECYLLVVLTKKPHVLKFWECDIHEIKER